MTRPATLRDLPAIRALAEAIGLFPPEGVHEVAESFRTYCEKEGGYGPGERFWLTYDLGGPVAVAYCEPERMADRVWNLLFLAVHPSRQGQGIGKAFLRDVEKKLIERGGRMLLVETSGQESFERVRAFYRRCGFESEARIRDYYQAGEDKITFRKLLAV